MLSARLLGVGVFACGNKIVLMAGGEGNRDENGESPLIGSLTVRVRMREPASKLRAPTPPTTSVLGNATFAWLTTPMSAADRVVPSASAPPMASAFVKWDLNFTIPSWRCAA